jgi:hypothetical protein
VDDPFGIARALSRQGHSPNGGDGETRLRS